MIFTKYINFIKNLKKDIEKKFNNKIDISFLKEKIEERFNKKINVLFLEKGEEYHNLKEQTDIILSPSFYWVQKRKLNIKFSFEAKKYIKTIFEDSLPDGEFSYKIIKIKKDLYVLVAYEDEEILKYLRKLDLKKIRNVHIAQTEFEDEELALSYSKDKALIRQEDIVINIDKSFIDKTYDLYDYINTKKRLSKHSIKLKTDIDFLISTKNIYIALFVLSFFNIFYFFEYMNKLSIKNSLITKKALIQEKYNLPSTNLQLNSIMKGLKNTAKAQLKLRKEYKYIKQSPLKEEEYFDLIKISNTNIRIKIRLEKTKKEDLDDYFNKFLKLKSSSLKNFIYEAEFIR